MTPSEKIQIMVYSNSGSGQGERFDVEPGTTGLAVLQFKHPGASPDSFILRVKTPDGRIKDPDQPLELGDIVSIVPAKIEGY